MRLSPIFLILAARGLRGFADGFAVILLPAYLSALGYDAATIGLIASTGLLGSSVKTIGMGVAGGRHDLRKLLLVGAFLMAATGLLVGLVEDLALILVVIFLGTMNPSTGDTGLIVPLEHATLAQAAPERRTAMFARYSLVGTLAIALGSLAAALPELLAASGLQKLVAFKLMFFAYAAIGLASVAIYTRIPTVEVREPPKSLLGPSRSVVVKLAALFSLDSFAGGFIVPSLLALWLFEVFDLSLAAASLFFFWAAILSSLSFLVAPWIAMRIGLVRTLVYTQLPSNLCLILAAFAPSLPIVLGLLLVRSALAQMDVPTRSSYVMAVVTPPERPAAASFTAVPRSLASVAGPSLAGALMATAFPGLPLLLSGVLKTGYCFAFLFTFRHIRPPEEAPRQP